MSQGVGYRSVIVVLPDVSDTPIPRLPARQNSMPVQGLSECLPRGVISHIMHAVTTTHPSLPYEKLSSKSLLVILSNRNSSLLALGGSTQLKWTCRWPTWRDLPAV